MSLNSNKDLSKIIKDLIDNKEIDDNSNNLQELKTLLSSANHKQLEEVLKDVNISQFCNDLNGYEDNQQNIDLIVGIFDVVFGSLPTDYILNKFQNEIINGLDAKNDSIIDLWLKTLDRCLTHELTLNHKISSDLDIHSILLKAVRLLSKRKTSTAKYCHSIVLNIAKSNDLSDKFFDKEIQNSLIETKGIDDIIRMRVYELLVQIAGSSHKTFCRVDNFGHLEDLLDDFKKDSASDPLVTLNILQIMTDLGSTSFGTKYLQSSDILKTISERLNESQNDIFGNLLIPGYIKIFGTLASNEPQILDKYPIVLNKIKALLDDLDSSLKLSAIDAIAIICHKNSGKILINKVSEMPEKYMSTISALVKSGNTELKSRALMAFCVLMKLSEPDPNSEATNFAEKWFKLFIPDNRMPAILNVCKEPFPEVRLSALELLRVLATYVWGQRELAAFPGFLQYILDRNTETTKSGKEAKYAVVRELVVSPFISLSFTKEAVLQLREFSNDGPYYVANETAVSFENAN